MYTLGNFVLWFLAAIAGFAFGIFFAGSFKLHQPLHVFSLAAVFAFICALIAHNLSKNVFHRFNGRMAYVLAGSILLSAIAGSVFLLIKVSL
jgi:hypothetical protein